MEFEKHMDFSYLRPPQIVFLPKNGISIYLIIFLLFFIEISTMTIIIKEIHLEI